jgi:hypothetical protein
MGSAEFGRYLARTRRVAREFLRAIRALPKT